MPIILILLVILFIFFEGFFSGSEIGLVSINRIKLKVLAEAKQKKASLIQNMLDNPNRMLCTMLIGTNIAVVSATAIFTKIVYGIHNGNSEWIATAIMAPLLLIFGEFIPKAIHSKTTNSLTYKNSVLLNIFWKLLKPIVFVITTISEGILKIFNINAKTSKRNPFVTKEEFKYLIKESQAQGIIDQQEKNIIYKIFDFGKTKAGQMMNNIEKLTYFTQQDTIQDLLSDVKKTNYSRYPIKSDDGYSFIGMVNVLDVIYEQDKQKKLSEFTRRIGTVNTDMVIDDVLLALQKKKEHIAIVVNETNQPIGFVTIEDLLEEIVGEI